MGRKLTQSERIEYIRKGNELFNKGKYKEAEQLFMAANYRDGILRIANRYFYELKKPLVALKFYYKIGAKERVEEIKERMIFALRKLMKEDETTENETSPESKDESEKDNAKDKSKDSSSSTNSAEEIKVKVNEKSKPTRQDNNKKTNETENGINPDEISP
ncbi:MAG: hypothetical protein ACOCV8_00025 [Spirochaetota bacterium]